MARMGKHVKRTSTYGARKSTYKRGRSSGGRATKKFRSGYDRTSGYYGRFSGAQGELKFHDVDVDDASIAANGTILNSGSINLIPQGVTEKTRVGRKCVIRSIGWRYNYNVAILASATAQAAETVRLIMYLDKQCNGATAAVTDLLESDNYQSFNKLANSGRFRILMDRLVLLEPLAGAGDGAANDFAGFGANGAFYKTCNIPLEFSSTTGAITEIRSNNIGVLILGKVGTTATLDSKVRLRFSDGS